MTPLNVAFLLILLGLVLMFGELLIPSGFMFALAIAAIVAGIVMVFLNAPDWYTPWLTLLALFVVVPLLASLMLRIWPKTSLGRRFFLHAPPAHEDDTVASMPVNLELEQLRGKVGRAISALRPSGVVDFDGRRVDVITEGMMVEAGQWVRCIDVRTSRVLVRPVEKMNLGDLEAADFR